MARLMLDTGVLVASVRGRLRLGDVADTDDLALPAVAVAELRAGTLMDDNPERAASQRDFLDAVLEMLPVQDYTRDVAEHHAELLAHSRRAGTTRGRHDLIVAATARATGRVVVTTDERARFGDLPGVEARLLSVG